MTLDTLTRPDLQLEPESRLAEGATPAFHLHPNVDAAPPERSAEPQPSTDAPKDERPRRGGGLSRPANQRANAAAKSSARHCGPEPHFTNASKGRAQTRPAKAGRSHSAPHPSEPAIEVPNPNHGLPAHGGDLDGPVVHNVTVPATLSVPAENLTVSNDALPGRGAAQSSPSTQGRTGGATPIDPASEELHPVVASPGRGGGQRSSADLTSYAAAKPSRRAKQTLTPIAAAPGEGDAPSSTETLRADGVATIVDLWRQRVDLRRAEARLNLQALAVCRRAHGGDKEAAQKAWGLIQKAKGDNPALALVVEPYRIAMAALDTSASALEKQLCKLVRPHPLWAWAKDVRGLGELSVAGLIGEAAGDPGAYKSVSALWKRFGLAVIDGGRQRRVAGAEDALRHGYAPQRRAFAYVLSTQLMPSQRDCDPYRAVYDRRKAYELEREIPKAHAHNRALRVMVKELFKHAWVADRKAVSE